MTLPAAFLERPIAHRALHGEAGPENSRAAIRAAIEAGYGIEIDLQLSSDGVPMVFHDYALARLTGADGPVAQRTAAELQAIQLSGSDEGIPTLDEVLELVAGRVPLLIELKDQDGALGPNVGPLEEAVHRATEGYVGPVALMSFNPHSVIALRALTAHPLGLTTGPFAAEKFPVVPERTRSRLARIPDLEASGACFISHDRNALSAPRVAEIRAEMPVLCWTIRSEAEEREARRFADNITFEGYPA